LELQHYVDAVRHELSVAAAAGGEDAQALAERLSAPLESSIRLALLDALSAAAEEITRELAPGSVEVRLRGRDPEFAVTPAFEGLSDEAPPVTPGADADEDGGTWRVTLRLPEHLKPRVDAAARRDGQSVNAWLVRAVTAVLDRRADHQQPGTATAKHFSGWVR
jgi:hypothetical protein